MSAPFYYAHLDAFEGLAQCPNESIPLILSDLPSGMTNASFDVRPDLDRLFAEFRRVVTPTGVIVLMASHFRFAREVADAAGPLFRYELIWHKSRSTGFFNAKRRPLLAHEYVLVCGGTKHLYEPQKTTGHRPTFMVRCGYQTTSTNYGSSNQAIERGGNTDRFPTSVLIYASLGNNYPLRLHPQQKPVALCRWLVRTYSHPGEIVLDPFAGSASTGVAALLESREFVGLDTDIDFVLRGNARLENFKHEDEPAISVDASERVEAQV